MMESIFDENGYLKSAYLNPKYRGNWISSCGDTITSICGDKYSYIDNDDGSLEVEIMYTSSLIWQFAPKDIPVGELCWFWAPDVLYRSTPKLIPLNNHYFTKSTYYIIVPYLIAETAEDAERLKDWAK